MQENTTMYAVLANTKTQFENDKNQLEQQIKAVQTTLNQPPPSQFNEIDAAARLTEAKSQDRMNSTNTAATVAAAIEAERQQAADQLASYTATRAAAETNLAKLEAELLAVTNEIKSLGYKLDDLVIEEARKRRSAKIAEYGASVSALLTMLIEIDALYSIIGESNGVSPRFCIAIPRVPSFYLEESAPWVRLQHEGFVFSNPQAGKAVIDKFNQLNQTIRDELYANPNP